MSSAHLSIDPSRMGPRPRGSRDEGGLEDHRAFLLAVARRSLGRRRASVDAASDYVQETFLAALRAEREGKGPRSAGRAEAAWLRRILKNKIHEATRRDSAEKRGGAAARLPLGDLDPAGSATGPPERLRRKLREEALDRAMLALPARDREILVLSIVEGWSRKRIAEHLGVTASYASRLCDHAARALHSAYLRAGGSSGGPA